MEAGRLVSLCFARCALWEGLVSIQIQGPMALISVISFLRCVHLGASAWVSVLAFAEIIISIATAGFHATLLYRLQLIDEASMLVALFTWLCIVLELPPRKCDVSLRICVAAYGLIFCVVHCTYGFVLIFQIHFILLILGGWAFLFRSAYFILCESRSESDAAHAKRVLCRYIGFAVLGFILWRADQLFCAHLSALPVNPQLHAWWHIVIIMSYNEGVALLMLLQQISSKRID